MPPVATVLALLLAFAAGTGALVSLGLAAARLAGGPGHDVGEAGRGLVVHGAAVLVLAASLTPFADHVTPIGRVITAAVLVLWAGAAMFAGAALAGRAAEAEARRGDDGDDDGGGGGTGRDDDPDPEPPWWPQFERDLAAWRSEREHVGGPR